MTSFNQQLLDARIDRLREQRVKRLTALLQEGYLLSADDAVAPGEWRGAMVDLLVDALHLADQFGEDTSSPDYLHGLLQEVFGLHAYERSR